MSPLRSGGHIFYWEMDSALHVRDLGRIDFRKMHVRFV
jgi:hypothetical protein